MRAVIADPSESKVWRRKRRDAVRRLDGSTMLFNVHRPRPQPRLLASLLAAQLVRATVGWATEAPNGGASVTASPSEKPPMSVTEVRREPDAFHFVLALILGAVLVGGLIRVYRVLQSWDSAGPTRQPPEGMRPVECGNCHAMQHVTTHGRIFMCFCCHSANRIPVEAPPRSDQQVVLIQQTGPLRRFEFKRSGENLFEVTKTEDIESSPTDADASEDNSVKTGILGRQTLDTESNTSKQTTGVLPQCVVCLDAVGNMVLLPCAHGSQCEECFMRIVQNGASAGVRCPHCRSVIDTVVKIVDVEGDVAKGEEVRIPIARRL